MSIMVEDRHQIQFWSNGFNLQISREIYPASSSEDKQFQFSIFLNLDGMMNFIFQKMVEEIIMFFR